jgi:TP901 family phage tail tape measure protein
MDTNMKLATMNNTKMAEAIRLTVGLYRNFGDSITTATTPMEKMAYVGDTLAFALNKSAADMNDIMQAFKYVASTANLAGVSIEEVTAGLIVLHNHMIRGSTAGMSLNMMFVQLSKNAGKIAEAFNLKIDTTKPLDLVDILKQIDTSGVAANKSLDDLAKMFTNFEVRAARAFATLIKNPKEFLKAYDDLVKGVQSEALDKVFETMMDNLDSQWQRFNQVMKTALVFGFAGESVKGMLKAISDIVESWMRITNAIEQSKSATDDWVTSLGYVGKIINDLGTGLQIAVNFFRPLIDPLGTLANDMKELAKAIQSLSGATQPINPALQAMLLTQKDISTQVAKQLSDDEKIQVSIAKGTASLQQQLSYAQKVADAAEKAFLANMNLSEDDKERTKSWNAYLSALGKVRQVQNQIDQSVKKTITSQEKQNKAAETLASIFREIVELELTGSTKTLTSDLEAAVDKANKLKVGTKEWNSAVKEVALAYKESLQAQDGLNKQIDKAISSFDKLKGAGTAFVDVLKQAGQTGLAEQVGQYMAQQAEQQLILARTDEQRLAALQNIVNVQKILTENEWGGADALQRQINAYAEMFNINSGLLTQETARAKQATELRTKAQAIFEKTKEWKAPVQQFNAELTKSNENMQEINVWSGNVMKTMKVMADQGGVNFQGSVEQAKVLNQNLTQTESVIGNANNALITTSNLMQQLSTNSQTLPIVWRGYSDSVKGAQQMMSPLVGQVMQLDAATGKLVMTTSELPTIWQGFSAKINAPLQMMSNSIIYFDDAVSATDTTLKEMTATIYSISGGLVNVDAVAGTVNNRMVQWNQSISGTANDIIDMGSTVYNLANGMLSVQQSSQSIADETEKWKRKQEELNMSFEQTNDTASDMGVEIYTLTKGMLEVATATDVSNKALKAVSDSTGDVNQDVGKISDNFDTAQKAVVQVSNAVQNTKTPIEAIKSKTALIQQDFEKWQSPLQTSFGTTENINSAMGNVANSVDRVLGKLDSMAQKIRSMPKLNVTGGGGGMPTNNDILTNPGYQ